MNIITGEFKPVYFLMKKSGLVKLFFGILFTSTALLAKAQSDYKLKLLGQVEIPYNYSFKDTPVGGLSGLAYDSDTKTFYVICDDRANRAPARFYSFKLQLDGEGQLVDDSIKWDGVRFMKSAGGKKYAKGTVDPEGIAVGPDGLIYISSEGDSKHHIAPFINAFSADGKLVKMLPVPKALWFESGDEFGIRNNLALEGLSISPDGKMLYTALENALFQDGFAADSVHSSPSRMIAYSLDTDEVVHQYEYRVSPVHFKEEPHDGFSVNGLSSILALDDKYHFFSFDRNYVQGQGNEISLYQFSTGGATDINGVESLQKYSKPVQSVQKTLVSNMSDYDITIDNFEGMALGPKLKDGGQLLLMVSDNNFSPTQRTLFTAFSLHK